MNLQAGILIRRWHLGCFWRENCRWPGRCTTWWCSVLAPSAAPVSLRGSKEANSISYSAVAQTRSHTVTPRATASVLKSSAHLSSFTLYSPPPTPSAAPETPMFRYELVQLLNQSSNKDNDLKMGFVLIFQILAPLPIGFAVFLVHLATIPITGTGINPARSLGAAIIFNQDHAWNDHVSIPPPFI